MAMFAIRGHLNFAVGRQTAKSAKIMCFTEIPVYNVTWETQYKKAGCSLMQINKMFDLHSAYPR